MSGFAYTIVPVPSAEDEALTRLTSVPTSRAHSPYSVAEAKPSANQATPRHDSKAWSEPIMEQTTSGTEAVSIVQQPASRHDSKAWLEPTTMRRSNSVPPPSRISSPVPSAKLSEDEASRLLSVHVVDNGSTRHSAEGANAETALLPAEEQHKHIEDMYRRLPFVLLGILGIAFLLGGIASGLLMMFGAKI